MTLLLAGLALFIATHAFTMVRGAREVLISALGSDAAYKGLYSLVSLAGFILIIYGYGQYRSTGMIPLWTPPDFGRHIAMLLMLFAMILLVATYLQSHIRSRIKHPMITAVVLWAIAHLLANGDLGSVILFGTFLVWGIFARISMGNRTKTIFAAPTLGPPLGFRNDLVIILLGVTVYAAFVMWLHPLLIGVPVIAL
jgi:uncharacterized membrane protein